MTRTILLATAAVLTLLGGKAFAERAAVEQHIQMAATGGGNHPESETNVHGTQYALVAPARTDGGRHAVLLAQGWHPQADTSRG